MELKNFWFGTKEKQYIRENVGVRFAYFYNYWTFVTSRHSRLILNKYKFESHIRLLLKISNFLKSNYRDSKKPYRRFLEHPYFQSNNIFIRGSKIEQTIERLNECNYEMNKDEIVNGINTIYKYFTRKNSYSRKLVKELYSLVRINDPVDIVFENNIKMLINIIIAELYKSGYTEDYIAKIPKIITLEDPINRYPFYPLIVFKTNSEYKEYLNSQKITLKFFIEGIKNILIKDLFKGYVFFKVPTLTYSSDQIKIGQCVFYNPTKEKIVSQRKTFGTNYSVEKFEYKKDEEKESRPSEFNVYLPILLRYPFTKLKVRHEIVKSRELANNSLQLLLTLLRVDTDFEIRVDSSKFFITNSDFQVSSFSFGIFHDPVSISVPSDEKFEEWEVEEIKRFNKLTDQIDFHVKIKSIIFYQSQFNNDINEFRFSKLWIAWESFLDKKQFKSLTKICFKLYAESKYVINIMLLLNSYLENYYDDPIRKDLVKLSNEDLNRFGLKFEAGKVINSRKFLKNYHTLFSEIEHPILDLIYRELNGFIKNRESYFETSDKWIEEIIDEFHMERHIEIHDDEFHEFSVIRLKKDFLLLSKINVDCILNNLNRANKNDFRLIRKLIKNAYNNGYKQ